MLGFEAGNMIINAVDADSKTANPIALGLDEISQTHVGAAFALCDLLTQESKSLTAFEDHIIAVAVAWP